MIVLLPLFIPVPPNVGEMTPEIAALPLKGKLKMVWGVERVEAVVANVALAAVAAELAVMAVVAKVAEIAVDA